MENNCNCNCNCEIKNCDCAKIQKLETHNTLMLGCLIYFCKRVKAGTIQSRTTYNMYIRTIEEVTGKKWEEVKKNG